MNQALTIPFAAETDFLAAGQALLPKGDAWPQDGDATLTALLEASVASRARVHAQVAVLTEQEAQPSRAVILLPAWEAAYGLPDPCTPLGASIAQRQAALVAKIAEEGSMAPAYYEALATRLGYTATVQEFTAFAFGAGAFGQPFYNTPWVFTWQVNVTGDALGSGMQLTCVMLRQKPAYIVLIMNYEVA